MKGDIRVQLLQIQSACQGIENFVVLRKGIIQDGIGLLKYILNVLVEVFVVVALVDCVQTDDDASLSCCCCVYGFFLNGTFFVVTASAGEGAVAEDANAPSSTSAGIITYGVTDGFFDC